MLYKPTLKFSQKNFFFVLTVVVYFILLITLANYINISEDEMYTLNTTSQNLNGVIKQSLLFEGQPPAYFIVLSWWRKFHQGFFFSKLFSILCIGLASLYFYRLATLLFGKSYSKWLTLILLLNPYTVWAALEIRTYAFLILLATMSFFYLYSHYRYNNKFGLFKFLLISLVGVYTQYFFFFLIGSLGIVVLISHGWKPFFRYSLYCLAIVILFLPNLHFISSQISLHAVTSNHESKSHYLKGMAHVPQFFMLGTSYIYKAWANRLIRLIFVLLWSFAYFKIYKNKEQTLVSFLKKYNNILLLILFSLIIYAAAFLTTGVIFNTKYISIIFPLFILLFVVFKTLRPPFPTLIYTCIMLYYSIILFDYYKHPVNTYDYKSLAKFIMKTERVNEPILIYRPALALSFEQYYQGKNSVNPIPHPVNFDSSYLINIRDTLQLKNSIMAIHENFESFLFISDTTLYEGALNMNRQMITDYLNSNYNIALDSLFYGFGKDRPLQVRRVQIRN